MLGGGEGDVLVAEFRGRVPGGAMDGLEDPPGVEEHCGGAR